MSAAEQGDHAAGERLFEILYAELHRLAKRELSRRGAPETMSATTLLHQAYIEMAGRNEASFPDQARFMGYTARVMRGLIIDHVRNRSAQKRGGKFEITSLGTQADNVADLPQLTQISEVLEELAKAEPELSEVVDLKFFCGFTFAEIAATKGLSERTVQRQWDKARIYLHRRIRADLDL